MTISTKHCKNKGKIHDIHTRHIVQNMSSKENMCIEENKNNCHNYKAYTTKFQQKNKKYKDKGTLDTSHIALLRSTLDTKFPKFSNSNPALPSELLPSRNRVDQL